MVDIIGRAKVIVESVVDSSSIDASGSKIGSGLKKGALIGVAALGTVAAASVSLYKDFEEAEKQSAKLANVLDNMGETKAIPAVEALSDELRKLTGVDDEVIKGGQTILATFSNVAESAGEMGGVFDRATRAAVDLSAAGFGNVESASVMLGKALQDPIKGVSALGRAGVTFSEDQKKVIEALIETGDVGKAQAIILGEVEKQVKGTAEASVTESEKIATAMGEIRETLGGYVAEIVTGEEGTTSFADSLERLNTELEELQKSEGWAGIRGAIRGVGHAFGFVINFMEDWSAHWEDLGGDTREGVEALKIGFRDLKTSIGDTIDDAVGFVQKFPERVEKLGRRWSRAGGKLIGDFVSGMAGGAIPSRLAERIKDAINSALPDQITFFGRAGGIPAITVPIPQFADGVRGFGGGLALVGERGPELVGLPRGADVYSNRESAAMVSGNTTVFNMYGPGSLSEARREQRWANQYGTRFGAAASAAAL